MGKLFDKQINNDGLSRRKIIFFGSVLSIVIVGLVFYGALTPDKVKDPNQDKPYVDSGYSRDTDILSKVKHNNESMQVITSAPRAIVKPNASSVIVPPIADTDEMQFKHQIVQLKQREILKAADEEYNGASSKTLMYSKFSKNNESTSMVITNNSISSSSSDIKSNQLENESGSGLLKPNYSSQIVKAKSPYELKAGSVIPSTMINGINSDLPGEVIALVRDNVYDSVSRKYLLIPQGARLVGLYDSNVTYGQERVAVAWNRLIYPDGSSIDLKATPGTDIAGYSGFYDQVDNKYWQIFGSSFIMGVITAGMQYSQNNVNTNVQSGGNYTNPSIGQTLAGSLGQQLGQTGLAITQKNLNVAPTIIIRQGYQFNIMLTADLTLRPLQIN